jgi:hypothetical protein
VLGAFVVLGFGGHWGGRAPWTPLTASLKVLLRLTDTDTGTDTDSGSGSLWWLLPWLSLPLAMHRVGLAWSLDGAALNPLLGATAKLQLLFCALVAAAALLAAPTT